MSKIACVFAHPDDEAFGPGGTIAKLAADHEVHLVCVTDGDVANTGLGTIRAQELAASAKILRVHQVHHLGFADGSLSNANYHQVAAAIQSILDQLRPESLLTFDENGLSGHLDHIAITSILNWLFPKLDYLRRILYFCQRDQERKHIRDYFVYMPPGRDRSEVQVVEDISAVWDAKVAAMRAHVSQSGDCEWILSIITGLPKEEWFRVRSKQ